MQKVLINFSKAVAGTASVVTLHSYYKSIKDNNTTILLERERERSLELERALNKVTDELLVKNINKVELDKYSSQLEVSQLKLELHQNEISKNCSSASELESAVSSVTEEISKSRNIIDKILDLYNSKNNEFMDDISDW